MGRNRTEDFQTTKIITTRLTADTLERLVRFCKGRGLVMWRWLERTVGAALDREDKHGS